MTPSVDIRPKVLGSCQALVIGMILDNAGHGDEEENAVVDTLWAHVEPRPASAEDLLTPQRFRLRAPVTEADAWALHGAFGVYSNVCDDQLEHRVGRGENPETRVFLREELRAVTALQEWITSVLRARVGETRWRGRPGGARAS